MTTTKSVNYITTSQNRIVGKLCLDGIFQNYYEKGAIRLYTLARTNRKVKEKLHKFG